MTDTPPADLQTPACGLVAAATSALSVQALGLAWLDAHPVGMCLVATRCPDHVGIAY